MRIENVRVGKEMEFDLLGGTDAIANLLRGALMCRIETTCVCSVRFFENTSLATDECIAQRLSMMPLVQSMVGEGTTLTLECEAEEDGTLVTAKSMLVGGKSPAATRDVVMKLNAGEKLKLEAYVAKGKGEEHARFNCATAVRYTKVPANGTEEEQRRGISKLKEKDGVHRFAFGGTGAMPLEEMLEKALRACVEAVSIAAKEGRQMMPSEPECEFV